MIVLEAVFVIIVAVFTVFGFYCAGRLIISRFAGSCVCAVVLEAGDDADILRMKLNEARACCICGKCETVVLIPVFRADDTELINLLDSMRLRYILITEI